jgi:RNA polymerase sigma-70 factor (ECF subfamily)
VPVGGLTTRRAALRGPEADHLTMNGALSYVHAMAFSPERLDAQVVRDVLAGDRDAYRLIVRRYGDILHGHALRMVGSPDVAADLVQQAFVKGYQKLHACRDPDRVGGWLFRILANLCKDHVRSPRRRDVSLHALRGLPANRVDPSEDVESAEARDRLRAALDRLTPEQRETFLLKHVEGLSYEEISVMMNTSIPALKMRVHRARESLQSLLEEFV